jgi:cytochrome P450
MTSPHIDLLKPEFVANPYPAYTQMRAELPVHRITLSDGRGVWLVTRYDDARAVLKDPRFIKDWRSIMSPEQLARMPKVPESLQFLSQHMLTTDPPNHTRLRALVQKAFTPRMVEELRPRVQEITDALLDAVESRGEMDLIDDFAFPLPITVIAELLGVPSEDRDKFRHWSNALLTGEPTPERMQRIAPDMEEFNAYLAALFAERRARPAEDLISALIQVEEAGDRLSQIELFSMMFLLLIAGHETTVNLIGNGMLALLEHPDQLERLKQHPELLPPAIEELLRYDGPVANATRRWAGEDVDVGGVLIPRGEQVMVVLASADRDDQRFANPDDLDIARADNRHIAFGHGIHYCLGAPLARLEGQIAIGTLLRRMPNLRLKDAPETLDWRASLVIRGLERLPVVF